MASACSLKIAKTDDISQAPICDGNPCHHLQHVSKILHLALVEGAPSPVQERQQNAKAQLRANLLMPSHTVRYHCNSQSGSIRFNQVQSVSIGSIVHTFNIIQPVETQKGIEGARGHSHHGFWPALG